MTKMTKRAKEIMGWSKETRANCFNEIEGKKVLCEIARELKLKVDDSMSKEQLREMIINA